MTPCYLVIRIGCLVWMVHMHYSYATASQQQVEERQRAQEEEEGLTAVCHREKKDICGPDSRESEKLYVSM